MPADRPGSSDPLSPERARDLLSQAGATVEVAESHGAAGDLPPRSEGIAALVAIAATVALIAGLGFVLANRSGDDPAPADPPTPTTSEESEYAYPAGQVPSLLGYTAKEATRVLKQAGWRVETRVVRRGCAFSGMVGWVSPAPGTRLEPGETVRIDVIRNRRVIDCVGEVDWQQLYELVRFARGLEGVPAMADEVEVAVAGAEAPQDPFVRDVVDSDDLERPDDWSLCADAVCYNPVHALAGMVTDPSSWDSQSPLLVAEWAFDRVCGGSGSAAGGGVRLWAGVPGDVVCPAEWVEVTYDRVGRITSLTALIGAGGDATGGDDAEPSDAAPADPVRAGTADTFVDWAREEGPAPAFADRVRFLVNGEPSFGAPAYLTEPERRWAWTGCSGASGVRCGISPITQLRKDGREIIVSAGRAGCTVAGLPPELETADADLVSLTRGGPDDCDGEVVVELWIDEAGEIYAVNLGMG
ncbi:PASTA domain-containing protein [Nocardioides sp. BGMRC 2183]|nr:PASTA domain-containing protein [Nocardioides sp. BGMRC 2183]